MPSYKDGIIVADLSMTTTTGSRTIIAGSTVETFNAGLRGGENFGVLTSFEYQLHPVGSVAVGAKTIRFVCCCFCQGTYIPQTPS
jgi:hypothetical protein